MKITETQLRRTIKQLIHENFSSSHYDDFGRHDNKFQRFKKGDQVRVHVEELPLAGFDPVDGKVGIVVKHPGTTRKSGVAVAIDGITHRFYPENLELLSP